MKWIHEANAQINYPLSHFSPDVPLDLKALSVIADGLGQISADFPDCSEDRFPVEQDANAASGAAKFNP